MRSVPALLGLSMIVLAGCLPQAAPPMSVEDRVSTSVAATLTAESPAAPPPTNTSPPPATLPATDAPTLEPPTATPSPTPTLSPTATTLAAGDPRTTFGQPAWRDPMDSPGAWNIGEDTYTKVSIEDGKLVLVGKSTIDGWRLSWPEVKDVYLEATIEVGECSGNDHYGLMFRVPDLHNPNEGYLLGFTCDGRYWLRSWDGEQMETIVGLTASSAINAGSNKTNRVGVIADGDKFSLYANGTLLQEAVDDTWNDEGGIGVFVGARKTDGFTIKADELAYWDLP